MLIYLRKFREELCAWLKDCKADLVMKESRRTIYLVYQRGHQRVTRSQSLKRYDEDYFLKWMLLFSNQQKTVNGGQHIETAYETGFVLMHFSRKNSEKIAKYLHFYSKQTQKKGGWDSNEFGYVLEQNSGFFILGKKPLI